MMLRKVIHFYITREADHELIHTLEMIKLPVEHDVAPPYAQIKPAVFWLCNAFNQYTSPVIPSPSLTTDPSFEPSSFTCMHRKKYSYFAPDDDNFYYQIAHSTFKLPRSRNQLYKFMLSLDGCIYDIFTNNEDFAVEVEFAYEDKTEQELIFSEIAHHLLTRPPAPIRKPAEYFSVFLSRWITVNSELYSPEVITELTQALSTQPIFMTKLLRQLLYPSLSHTAFCTYFSVDQLLSELFNPAICSSKSTEILLNKIKLSRDLKATMPSIFAKMDEVKKMKWATMVKSLYAMQGTHEEFYHNKHPVILLLLDADLELTGNGLLKLNYKHTKSYLEHFANGKQRHELLAHEISHVFHLLNFGCVRDTNFHSHVIFDDITQKKLRDAGYHYSEKFAKSLFRTANRFTIFNRFDMSLELQEAILSYNEPTLSHEDMNLLEQLTLQLK